MIYRVLSQSPYTEPHDQQPHNQEHHPVVKVQTHEVHQAAHNYISGRRQAADGAQDVGSGGGVEILESQRLVCGLVVMKSEAHEHGGRGDTDETGKVPGHADTRTQDKDG